MSMPRHLTLALLATGLLASTSAMAQTVTHGFADAAMQERQCQAKGWQRVVTQVAGLSRQVLWKAPTGPWTKGAILVMHGGGGQHFQWCVANARIVRPQVNFSEMAVADGFAVLLLNSSDQVTDHQGRACGKVWDDEVRERANLDLPFLGQVMRELLPSLRPAGSRPQVFLAGHSSGGYMAVRAATHFDDLVTAFAPVASGDPYGWHRLCEAGMNARTNVHGAGFDNETRRQITEPEACRAERHPNEKPWDSTRPATLPAFRLFRHEQDGINDRSCTEKVGRQLRERGYRGEPDFVLMGGRRSLAAHYWQDGYNRPLLDFFNAQLVDTPLGAPR